MAASACFHPDVDLENCTLPCDSTCPQGFHCVDAVCARDGAEAECARGAGGQGAQNPVMGSGGAVLAAGGSDCGFANHCISQGGAGSGGTDARGGAPNGGAPDTERGGASIISQTGGVGGGGSGGEPVVEEGGSAGRGGAPIVAQSARIEFAGTTTEPPAPCAGVEYEAAFRAINGTPPYTWSATALPPGFAFDPETQIVSSHSVSSGETLAVTLRVVDSAAAVSERTFSLTPRDRCWLAYLSVASSGSRVELFDPVRDVHLDVPQSAPDEIASDLRFSPNGRLLTYRTRLADGSYRLRVRAAPTFSELPLMSHGSVKSYAWSPDSTLLAIAFETNGVTTLGGLGVKLKPQLEVSNLDPVSADVRGELTWFGQGLLAFPSLLEEIYWTPSLTQLSGNGFAAPVALGVIYDPGLLLHGTSSGFFAIDTTQRLVEHYGFDGPSLEQIPSYVVLYDSWMDPAGRYSARVTAETLGVYDLSSGAITGRTPLATGPNCSELLAWADGAERFACSTQADSESRVRIYRLSSNATSLSWHDTNGSYDYPTGTALYQARAFSNSGAWFAFSSESRLYVADARSSVPYLARNDGLLTLDPKDPDVSRVRLSFSPDEQFLLQHRASQLSLHRLDAREATPFVVQGMNGPLRAPAACEVDYAKDPFNWCGATRTSSDFAWSPDSVFVAYETLAGKLFVADLRALVPASSAAQTLDTLLVESACSGCPFAFQP